MLLYSSDNLLLTVENRERFPLLLMLSRQPPQTIPAPCVRSPTEVCFGRYRVATSFGKLGTVQFESSPENSFSVVDDSKVLFV